MGGDRREGREGRDGRGGEAMGCETLLRALIHTTRNTVTLCIEN